MPQTSQTKSTIQTHRHLVKLIRWACLCALLLAACGRASTAMPTPTPYAGDDWQTYSAAGGQFSFAYPPTWSETSPGLLEGDDGFARVELHSSAEAGPGALCQGEANRGKPEAYGAVPEIRELQIAEQPACLILPSDDQPADRLGEARLLVWRPSSGPSVDDLLVLRADRHHIQAIANSLALAESAPEPSSACDFSPAAQPVETVREAGLRVDLFPLALADGCIPALQSTDFYPYIDSGAITERLDQLRALQSSPERVERLNTHLRPYGVALETYDDGLFRFKKDGQTLRDNLSWIGQFSDLPDRSDYLLPMLDGYNATAYLAGPSGVERLDNPDLLVFDNIFPVIADGRVRLAYDTESIPRPPASPALVRVLKDEQEIAVFSISGSSPAGAPVRGLWSWQGHWVMQLPGLVIEDGESLNDSLGCAEMFGWQLLREKPFYLCRKVHEIHATYDQQTLSLYFDEVMHEPQIGSAALVQMRTYESGLAFLAQRKGVWYFVVIEAE